MSRVAALLLGLLAATPAAQTVAAQTGPAHLAERSLPAASPAARPFGGAPGQTRLAPTFREPLGALLPSAPPRRSEPAPVPNRDIEPPRTADATDGPGPRLEPMLLPPERGQGMTFGREHLRETGPDRPFDNILPGARLRIPFDGGGGRH